MAEVVGQHYVLSQEEARSGGLSTVRKAVDIRDLSTVAVKISKGDHTDELNSKVFERETRNLRELKHANIVAFRDSGVDGEGNYFIVLDWIDLNLHDFLRENGPWSSWIDLYESVGRPLLRALAFAHLHEIEHRDLKPKNVLMTPEGIPLLADFGISKGGDSDNGGLTVKDFRSGMYAPPESETPIRYVRDVYSFGVLMLRCLGQEAMDDLAALQRTLGDAPLIPDVRTVLTRCVHIDPYERPRSASELLAILDTVAANERARREKPRNPIWLHLTRTAREQLSAEALSPGRADAVVLGDLSGEVFASFATDRETGRPLRDTILLFGAEHRYTLKVEQARLVVVAARAPELEQLEGGRRFAAELPPIFDWSTRPPADRSAAAAAVATVMRLLDGHEEPALAQSAVPTGEEEAVFDAWNAGLDAREELSRGEHKPLRYVDFDAKGARCRFQLEEACELELLGTDWEVFDPRTGYRYSRGEVIEQSSDAVTLLSHIDFKGMPSKATLRPYDGPSAVALNRQRAALRAVRERATPNPSLRDLLLSPESCLPPRAVEVEEWGLDLDEQKRSAVSAALGAPQCLLVQGPPGTGKTSFIAELVLQFLKANPDARVLIASQTHVAVDNAVERLHASGVKGLVRLAGAEDAAVQPGARHLLLDNQLRLWADEVRRRAEKKMSKEAAARGVEEKHLRAALVLEQLAAVTTNIEILESQARELDGADPSTTALETALEGEDPHERIQSRIEQLAYRRKELVDEAQRQLAGDLTISMSIDSSQARSAVELLLGDHDGAVELMRLLELQANWLERIATERSLASIFLAGTSVVAGTCTGYVRLPEVAELEFDLCVVDEASKATLTEALVPMSRAKRWILVGDTNQLPPMDEDLLRRPDLLKEHSISAEQIEETLFQRMVLRLPDEAQAMLTEQYRMIRPIGDLISTCFYDGVLRSPKDERLKGYDAVMGAPAAWIDTAPLNERRREQKAGTSRANRAEAQLLVEQLVRIDKAVAFGLLEKPSERKLEVLVIAPYRGQVEELSRQILPKSLEHLEISVMSIDAVQGRECDVALLSVTRSNPDGALGFLGPEYWRRINVALSRARFGLTIVGDAEFIRGTRGALRNVLEYMGQHPGDCSVTQAGT
ncbi:serine/threonine-protein kinase [Phycicoccus sp. Soil802]|uniref:serine/threonine-protein kinase n=1 Tax=Phycicoccus sp. Soil802 TaxID=1736414 RepID=UPI0009EB77BE|nr:serine/threonine-protein kinase [Phycicoccus sp. Soil802]